MGFTPNYAVRVARDWLRQRQEVLLPACATPHQDVSGAHNGKYGPVGMKVFLAADGKTASLVSEVMKHQQAVRRNPQYLVEARVIPTKAREREGEKLDAQRILRSLVLVEKNATKIAIVDQGNVCWHRFVCAKELAHVLTFGQGERVDDPAAQLDLAFKLGTVDADWNAVISREQFAWVLAIEMLLPWWHRDCLHQQIQDEIDLGTIAQHFRVPRTIIDTYALTEYREKSMRVIQGA